MFNNPNSGVPPYDFQERITGLNSAAHECLWQLFRNGPTWDGDIVSKSGRGDLFQKKYASRVQGWSFLTEVGMEFAVRSMLMGDRKEKWDRDRRRA